MSRTYLEEDAVERWEGTVEEVTRDYFVATLINTDSNFTVTSEIPISKVPLVDHNLIHPGAFFTWTLGVKTINELKPISYSDIFFYRNKIS